jgi:hypothetical protein
MTMWFPINPETLFQRMCIVKQSNEELQEYLQYELAPYPMSLFSEEGMRKGTKSSLYKVFSPVSYNIEGTSRIHIVDGGYLLHRVVILNFKLGHYTMEAVGVRNIAASIQYATTGTGFIG